jgi:hypothetical protein
MCARSWAFLMKQSDFALMVLPKLMYILCVIKRPDNVVKLANVEQPF